MVGRSTRSLDVMEKMLRRVLPPASLGLSILAWVIVLGGVAYASIFVSDQPPPPPRGIVSSRAVVVAMAIYAGIFLAASGTVGSLLCIIAKANTRISSWAFGAGMLFFVAFVTIWMGAWRP